jgi:hypothetical protein
MKRLCVLLSVLLLPAAVFSYELGTETWDRFTVLDPAQRAMGLTYPRGWLEPGEPLSRQEFADSSYTYARWEQIFTVDRAAGTYGFSGDIVVKYIPFSFPHRWSAAMEMISYRGPNSTEKSDVLLKYRNKKGSLQYFHTSNSQRLTLRNISTVHHIRTHGLNFEHRFGEKLGLSGGLDFNLIGQQDSTSRNYDTFHQFAKLRYVLGKDLTVYTAFEHRQFWNPGRHSTMLALRPGLQYRTPRFFSHLALRISPKRIFPIAQVAYRPGVFSLEAYAKVRNPLPLIMMKGYQYVGLGAGLDMDGEHHDLQVRADVTLDFAGGAAGYSSPYALENFYAVRAEAEYRFSLKSAGLYAQGTLGHVFNVSHVYYYPELSTLTAGFDFRAPLADGKLPVDGDINLQYIIHEDPDNVDFDPQTLLYSRSGHTGYAGDMRMNLRLQARLQSFSIAAELSSPLKAGEDLNWYFYEGIYTSSAFVHGNTLYAGINIEWYWWK